MEEEKAKTEKQAEELRSNMLGKVEGFGSVLEDMKRSLDMLEGKLCSAILQEVKSCKIE